MSPKRQPIPFSTSLRWSGGRTGQVSAAGAPDLGFALPPEFGGPGGAWTPETLLVASAEACTLLTFLAQAAGSRLEVLSYASRAEGTLAEDAEGKLRFVELTIAPHVTVATEADAQRARTLFGKTATHCFVGSSLKSEPRILPVIEVAQATTTAQT